MYLLFKSVLNTIGIFINFNKIEQDFLYPYTNTIQIHLQAENAKIFRYSKFFCKNLLQFLFLCYDGIINNASQLCEMFIVQSHQI